MSGQRRRPMAVRTPDPEEVRQRRVLTAAVGIGAVVVVLIVGIAFLVGSGGPAPTASATSTATAAAAGSGSPSARPSSSATAPASATATAPAATTTGPVTSPTEAPATATPGPVFGDAIAREAVFSLLGIDDLIAPEAIPRRITFNVEGQGDIEVTLSDVTAGEVRMCLYQGDASVEPPDADCIVTTGGKLARTPTGPGPWTIWLFGDHPGRSPAATLRIRWAADNAALQLADFRFQGTDSPNYTGFRVRVVPVAEGELHLVATWDDGLGGDYPYLVVLTDLDGSGEPPIYEGEGDSAEAVRAVVAGNNYEAAIDNTEESVIDQVLLRSTITWP